MMRVAAIGLLLLTIATYLVTNLATVPIMEALTTQSCLSRGWFVQCHLPADTVASPLANIALAVVASLSIVGLIGYAKQTSIFPFGMLICVVTLLTIALDAVLQRGVLNHDRLVNDTMNALSIVLLGSFGIVISIAGFRALPVSKLSAAILCSFGIKIAGMVVFGFLEQSFRGPVELWLLYGVFVWMVFGLHLMSISLALAGIDNRSVEAEALS